MAINVKSQALGELVDEDAEVERLATGFTFTEGPIWNTDGYLHFSDMPGDVRRRWQRAGWREEVLRDPSNKCNGMTFDNDGNLLVCEHVTSSARSRAARRHAGDARHPLSGQGAQQPERRDHRARTARSTSPTRAYGRMPGFGLEREQELGFQGVYRMAAGGGEPELRCPRTSSSSPTGCASRPTSRCSTSTTPPRAHYPRLRRAARRHAHRTAACSSTASARA